MKIVLVILAIAAGCFVGLKLVHLIRTSKTFRKWATHFGWLP